MPALAGLPFRISGHHLLHILILLLLLAGFSATPVAAESEAAVVRTAKQEVVWRRTVEGWERTIDWPREPAPTEISAAGAIHPSIIGLLQLGLIVGAFLLFPAANSAAENACRR